MTKTKASRRSNAPFLALLALAFFVRILVPTGWMPAQGEVGFVPCPAAALVAAQADAHRGHGDHAEHRKPAKAAAPSSDQHGDKKGCDFAPLGLAMASPPPAAAIPEAHPLRDINPATSPRVFVGQGLAAPPPPATGPPRLS